MSPGIPVFAEPISYGWDKARIMMMMMKETQIYFVKLTRGVHETADFWGERSK